MNIETRIPASFSAPTYSVSRGRSPTTSSPPSVVTSCRFLGDEAAGMRRGGQRDRLHLVGRRHPVERDPEPGLQRGDVAVADVAAVLAQVGGDAVRARRLGQKAARSGSG